MKKIFRMAIVCALAGAALLTGCTKDYTTEIEQLQSQVANLESQVASLQKAIDSGCTITNVQQTADGYVVTTSDNKTYTITNGKDGKDGTNGKDGVNGKDGKDGADGKDGVDGKDGKDGKDGVDGKDGKDGTNGKSAYDLAKEAGYTGTLEEWLASLQGKDGNNGKSAYELAVENGFKGTLEEWIASLSPIVTIQEVEGVPYWFINGEKTEYVAKGDKGDKGDKGEAGNYWKYDADAFQWVEYKLVDGVETATGVTKDIFPNGYRPLTAFWTEDALTFANVVEGYDADGNAIFKKDGYKLDLRATLNSIVSIPDLYYAGIEAFKYYYLEYEAGGKIEGNANGLDDLHNPYQIFSKDSLNTTGSKPFYAGSISVAHYFINPERYNLDNADWALYPDDKAYMPLFGTKHTGWTPNFVSAERDSKNAKVVAVKYTIDNSDCLEPDVAKYEAYLAATATTTVTGTTGSTSPTRGTVADCDVDVSIMHLEGVDSVNNNEIVASDFAAVVPMKQGLAALAFTVDYSALACPDAVDFDHLWLRAEDAAENTPSVPVYYNGGDQPLNFVGVHMLDADETMPRTTGAKHILKTLKELQATYPDFDMTFEFVSCKLGIYETVEEAFGKIKVKEDGYYFAPCYADASGNPVEIATLPASLRESVGISAVGRRPIVLVKLIDKANKNNIVLAGYFKIQITKEVPTTPTVPTVDPKNTFDGIIVKDFSDKPFTFDCSEATAQTVWTDFNEPVLENFLNIEYDVWKNNFEWLPGPTAPATSPIIDTYLYKEDKTKGTLTYDTTLGYNKYGTVEYLGDTGALAINDVFKVTVDWNQKQQIVKAGGEVTLWTLFRDKRVNATGGYDYYYFGLKVKVNDHADASFILHNSNYWFDELQSTYKESTKQTVRRNVRVPDKWITGATDNDSVQIYEKFLTDDWVGNIIQIVSGGKTYTPRDKDHNIVATYTDNIFYKFLFSKAAEQPYIDGKKWIVSDDRKTLSYKLDGRVAEPVVTIDDITGLVTYVWEEDSLYTSKVLLNKWAPYSEEINEILYGNVDLIAYSKDDRNGCEIELGTEMIHVRFLRPITVKFAGEGKLRDAVPTGDALPLGDLMHARDWNRVIDPEGFEIFFFNETTGSFETCYYPDAYDATTKKVEWYGYYGFKNLAIDINNIKSNQNGSWDYIRKINPAAKFWLAPAADHLDDVTYGVDANGFAKVDISDVKTLSDIVFVYFNNVGVVENFDLEIPVYITYAWGVYPEKIIVPVEGTKYHPELL